MDQKHVYADYKSLDKDLIVALLTMLRHESLSDMLSQKLARRLGCCCSENGALVCEEAVNRFVRPRVSPVAILCAFQLSMQALFLKEVAISGVKMMVFIS